MKLTFWYLLMTALLWSVFYRSAMTDKRTRFCVRLGLTGTAAAALVGMAAPLYGWSPDPVVVVITMAIVYMQMVFAQFWRHHVPEQYIKPGYRILRRRSDFQASRFGGAT